MRNKHPKDRAPRKWLVLEGDWGGQIFATVPVDLLPSDLTEEEIGRALNLMNDATWSCQPGEGISAYQTRNHTRLRKSVVPATGLSGWMAVGSVFGGMGGGLLLENDMWFHESLLERGLGVLNQFRAALRLPPLQNVRIYL